MGVPAWRRLGRSEGQASGCKMAFFSKMILEFHCSMRTESQTLLFLQARKRLGRWKGGRKKRERASTCQSKHQSNHQVMLSASAPQLKAVPAPGTATPEEVGRGPCGQEVSSSQPYLCRPHLYPAQAHGGPAQPLLCLPPGQAGEGDPLCSCAPGLGRSHPVPLLAFLLLFPAPG